MTGSVVYKGERPYSVVRLGKKVNKDGKLIPNQVWTPCDSKREAEAKNAELINQWNKGEYIPDSKTTVGEWLSRWLEVYTLKSSRKKIRTKETYQSIVERHLIPALGDIPLQKLTPTHLQQYYNTSSLSDKTLSMHQAVIHQALKVAMIQEKLIKENPAVIVAEKPNGKKSPEMETWEEEDVKRFLSVAKEKGIQTEAFYVLALETGMRKGEICGLKWEDINFNKGTLAVKRTLLKAGVNPKLGTPKSGKSRTLLISESTLELLRKAKVKQAELKLKMGELFDDQGFVFTKKNGGPLQLNNLGENQFNKLIE
ncbi:MAG: site-specific integrase [Firmicutes bacterium]|nr:site-specific integrase [Bacillota bacterium]